MLTVLTLTGDRPEAFALSEHWMQRQTYKDYYEWLVVDDGRCPTLTTMGQSVLRITEQMKGNSQHRNMLAGLAAAQGDGIVMWEDDDYFGPRYLEETTAALARASLVGQIPSRYWHVGLRTSREYQNNTHASLCQTAFQRNMIPAVVDICHRREWIDLALWKRYRGLLYPGNQVVGIKGMPGRAGVSRAHNGQGVGWQPDPNLARLKSWIGEDAEEYRNYGKQQ